MAKLNDPERDVQYVALISAAEILGKDQGDFAPEHVPFRTKASILSRALETMVARKRQQALSTETNRAETIARFLQVGRPSVAHRIEIVF